MPIFASVIAGSGAPIIYGQPVILVQNPTVTNNHIVDTSRDITVAQPSGSTFYFDMLNNRFKTGTWL